MINYEELAARVEAGGASDNLEGKISQALYTQEKPQRLIRLGFTTSLDAAKALHDAVLPGWKWEVGSAVGIEAHYWADVAHKNQLHSLGDEVTSLTFSSAPSPAAAWVAAILRAKGAEK